MKTHLDPVKPKSFSKKYNSRCLIRFLGQNKIKKTEVIKMICAKNKDTVVVSEEYLLNGLLFKNIDKDLSSYVRDVEINKFFDQYEKANLLIIEDVGKLSTYSKESFGIMFLILNTRYIKNKPTIFTSSLKIEEVPDYFRQSYTSFNIEGFESYYFSKNEDNTIYLIKETNDIPYSNVT